jgi:Cys/Met metabolism PLP-dependent enzyme
MSHASIPVSLKQIFSLPADLVRISVGIEDVDYLIEDLARVCDCLPAAGRARHSVNKMPPCSVNMQACLSRRFLLELPVCLLMTR